MTESVESTEEKHPHGFGYGEGNGLPYCGIHKCHPKDCFVIHNPIVNELRPTKGAAALSLDTSIQHVLKQRDNGAVNNSEAQRGDGTQALEPPR